MMGLHITIMMGLHFMTCGSFWRFEKDGRSNGCDGSRRAHIELWVPCRCMKGMESDWLNHITWRKVEVKIKVLT